MTVKATFKPFRAHIVLREGGRGVDDVELVLGPNDGPREAYLADRERHLRNRPCVIDGCDELIPCPSHGEPAEDRGERWFRQGKAN